MLIGLRFEKIEENDKEVIKRQRNTLPRTMVKNSKEIFPEYSRISFTCKFELFVAPHHNLFPRKY